MTKIISLPYNSPFLLNIVQVLFSRLLVYARIFLMMFENRISC